MGIIFLSNLQLTTCNYSLHDVVNYQKKFQDVFVGLLGSMNDVRILCFSSLNKNIVNGNMFHINKNEEEIKPYLIVDKVYLLLPWLMIPHKQYGNIRHIVLEELYKKHLSQGISVVENSFGILKMNFQELFLKTNLHVLFLPDVVICCCILYNMIEQILDGKDLDIETLMVQRNMENSFNFVR